MLAYYPKGVPLFTSPDWKELGTGSGEFRFDASRPRVHRGTTRCPVVVAHFPALLAHRSGATSRPDLGEGDKGSGSGKGLSTLRGEAARDLHLLSTLQASAVY